MLFAASGLVFLLFVTVSVATILDARARIRHRATEMNRASVSWNEAVSLGYGLVAPGEIETLKAAKFSSSLLSIIEVHSDANRSSSQAEAAVGALANDSRD
jgi:hypothetical protein